MEETYDFVVIGGGSAGYAGARTAVDLGLKTAVIDGADELGGLCILKGCMPSKTLIESANRFRSIRRADEFGLRASNLEVHANEIIARKRRLIDDFASYRQGQLQEGNFELIRGFGAFSGPTEIEISLRDGGTRKIHAQTVLIATGSVISAPPIPGLAETPHLTSDDILNLEKIPESTIVLGGGAIALEMAHYLDALGSKVTIIQRSPRVLKELDPDVTDAIEQAFTARGMNVFCDTNLEKVEQDADGGKTVHFRHIDAEKSVTGDEILMALGRKPAVARLQLEQAGVETNGAGQVAIRPSQVTSQPHIFAAGDACGPLEVVHTAIQQAEVAAFNAARRLGRVSGDEKGVEYRLKLFGVFSEPQVAFVGTTEHELRERGADFRCACYPFDDHGKSMVMGETHGFVKLIADATSGEILGGSVVGPEAVDLIHEIVVAMHFRSTVRQLMEIPHYHPTLSEIWTYPAEELAELISSP